MPRLTTRSRGRDADFGTAKLKAPGGLDDEGATPAQDELKIDRGDHLGATWLLPRLIGAGRATEVSPLGRPVSSAEAQQWGLVSRTVPDEECMTAATEVASTLAHASGSVGRIRRLLQGSRT